MALSEDAIAIVASNLTAAYCALMSTAAGGIEPNNAATSVKRTYEQFLREVRASHPSHDGDPPQR